MATFFKIHSRNDKSIQNGWGKSIVLDSDKIKEIEDIQEGGERIDVSSIASPFAHFLLVEEAFKHLAAMNIFKNFDFGSQIHNL